MTYTLISANDLDRLATAGGTIIDVRTPVEYTDLRLKHAHEHIPLDQINPQDFTARRGLDKGAPIYLLCKGGTRAKAAAEKFVAEGYTNVHAIEGGLMACENCGLGVEGTSLSPRTEENKTVCMKVIPLERQVRIVAGVLAALGSLWALIGSSSFALIPLAVGIGLVYAGITDRCGVALILSKAPWNQGDSKTPSAQKSSCDVSGCS